MHKTGRPVLVRGHFVMHMAYPVPLVVIISACCNGGVCTAGVVVRGWARLLCVLAWPAAAGPGMIVEAELPLKNLRAVHYSMLALAHINQHTSSWACQLQEGAAPAASKPELPSKLEPSSKPEPPSPHPPAGGHHVCGKE